MNEIVARLKVSSSRENGFTLVELMVTILIIGILAAIAVPIYLNQQVEAHKAQVRSDVMSTVQTLSQWQLANGTKDVPADLGKVTVKSDAETSVSIRKFNASDPVNYELCVEASKMIADENFIYNYSMKTKQGKNGVCVAAPLQDVEDYE